VLDKLVTVLVACNFFLKKSLAVRIFVVSL
jgi:hypothetical protein